VFLNPSKSYNAHMGEISTIATDIASFSVSVGVVAASLRPSTYAKKAALALSRLLLLFKVLGMIATVAAQAFLVLDVVRKLKTHLRIRSLRKAVDSQLLGAKKKKSPLKMLAAALRKAAQKFKTLLNRLRKIEEKKEVVKGPADWPKNPRFIQLCVNRWMCACIDRPLTGWPRVGKASRTERLRLFALVEATVPAEQQREYLEKVLIADDLVAFSAELRSAAVEKDSTFDVRAFVARLDQDIAASRAAKSDKTKEDPRSLRELRERMAALQEELQQRPADLLTRSLKTLKSLKSLRPLETLKSLKSARPLESLRSMKTALASRKVSPADKSTSASAEPLADAELEAGGDKDSKGNKPSAYLRLFARPEKNKVAPEPPLQGEQQEEKRTKPLTDKGAAPPPLQVTVTVAATADPAPPPAPAAQAAEALPSAATALEPPTPAAAQPKPRAGEAAKPSAGAKPSASRRR
jgi:hypothetical protein